MEFKIECTQFEASLKSKELLKDKNLGAVPVKFRDV